MQDIVTVEGTHVHSIESRLVSSPAGSRNPPSQLLPLSKEQLVKYAIRLGLSNGMAIVKLDK